MIVKERYINPFTDFGFKKLFGTNLTERPKNLQERIFQRLFEAAEIAKFSPEEKELYEESLKSYRDLKNVIDTAYDEGEAKGKIEGMIEEKKINILNALKRGKLSIEEIAEDFNTTIDFVLGVKQDNKI